MAEKLVFASLPPPPEQRVANLYAWVAKHRDGSEGLLGSNPGGAMVVSRKDSAELMRPAAMGVGEMSRRAGEPVEISLVEFERTGATSEKALLCSLLRNAARVIREHVPAGAQAEAYIVLLLEEITQAAGRRPEKEKPNP